MDITTAPKEILMKRWRYMLALGLVSPLLLFLLSSPQGDDSRWGDVVAAYLGGIVGMVLAYFIRRAPRTVSSPDTPSRGTFVVQSLVALAVPAWLGLRKADWSHWLAIVVAWLLGVVTLIAIAYFEKKAAGRPPDSSLATATDHD